jgi:hypothetical protein
MQQLRPLRRPSVADGMLPRFTNLSKLKSAQKIAMVSQAAQENVRFDARLCAKPMAVSRSCEQSESISRFCQRDSACGGVLLPLVYFPPKAIPSG